MLKELLVEIKNADYISKSVLADKLGQPMAVIEDGFSQLIGMGYLKEDTSLNDCEITCRKCPYASLCNKVAVNTVTITEKGEELLAGQTKQPSLPKS
jgi:hypothetical protein